MGQFYNALLMDGRNLFPQDFLATIFNSASASLPSSHSTHGLTVTLRHETQIAVFANSLESMEVSREGGLEISVIVMGRGKRERGESEKDRGRRHLGQAAIDLGSSVRLVAMAASGVSLAPVSPRVPSSWRWLSCREALGLSPISLHLAVAFGSQLPRGAELVLTCLE